MGTPFWRKTCGDYKGLAMRCAPGTHDAAVALLMKHCKACAGFLDVASGSGALVQRLLDQGFTDPVAIELDAEKFELQGIRPRPIDLNGDFSTGFSERFRVITAVEIIEHLDSPRHLLTQLRNLLHDDGMLLLTTPNVAHWMGRLKFLLRGELRHFDENQYLYNHHVSPIVDIQMRHMCREIGLNIVDCTTAATFFGWGKSALLSPVEWTCKCVMGPSCVGDVRLYLMQKSTPVRSNPIDWTTSNARVVE